MARSFRIPVIVVLVCAFVLSFIVSISLPHLKTVDIARINFASGGQLVIGSSTSLTQIRFGIWAPCYNELGGGSGCADLGHGYTVVVASILGGSETVTSAWTRGLAVHPVATGVTFVALVLSISNQISYSLYAFIATLLATFLALLAFVIDIALEAHVKTLMNKLNQSLNSESSISLSAISTSPGPGFWISFVSLILLIVAANISFLGRRKDRMSDDDSYPLSFTKNSIFSRFRS